MLCQWHAFHSVVILSIPAARSASSSAKVQFGGSNTSWRHNSICVAHEWTNNAEALGYQFICNLYHCPKQSSPGRYGWRWGLHMSPLQDCHHDIIIQEVIIGNRIWLGVLLATELLEWDSVKPGWYGSNLIEEGWLPVLNLILSLKFSGLAASDNAWNWLGISCAPCNDVWWPLTKYTGWESCLDHTPDILLPRVHVMQSAILETAGVELSPHFADPYDSYLCCSC